ncbi:MAG: hypothetical protein K2L34_09645 [Muribaculaceae bacterium]|nr:hypothetical protein [Muribaculaceae bacterium]
MIKVGIIGADSPDAGELLRILIHHPEVDIRSLYAPAWAGRMVTSRHHGFLGEDIVNFSEKLDPSHLDIVFLADNSEKGTNILLNSESIPELRIVDMSPARIDRCDSFGMEYGLSEANRKPLVRGARIAVVPTPAAALALISLYPLAMNQLLNSDIEITIDAPRPIAPTIDIERLNHEITSFLQKTQNNFNGKINIYIRPCDSGRSMRVSSVFKSPLAIAEVDNIFESVYDDHNFTFTSLSEVNRLEVEGTHKCIVSIQKPGAGLLEITAVGDCHIRGGAGDAVHIMNLFFALDEKVGLHLKPSCFSADKTDTGKSVSWFA